MTLFDNIYFKRVLICDIIDNILKFAINEKIDETRINSRSITNVVITLNLVFTTKNTTTKIVATSTRLIFNYSFHDRFVIQSIIILLTLFDIIK